ncbi:Mdm33 family-domain-containing protein [Bisporella sp. PMI_857]|nr:Mdm33 family-domain-containing protein [Bisporella sp. PMI_857]
MQPLVRFAPRLVLDSIPCSTFSSSLQIESRQSIRTATVLQCRRRRHQARLFSHSPKPPTTSSSITDTEKSPPSSTTEDVVHENLPSAEEGRRSEITKRFSHIMDHLQSNIFIASQRINDLTGYSGIEALKSRITSLETRVQDAQEGVRSARLAYKTMVADRASTQKEVTTLLARKDSWTPLDLERFTSLYRMDHSNEQAVQEAATRLADAEREAEHAASKLSSSILSRYHEEQIWSDKIRRMSTWGTWGLMGVNILLFFVFQFGFEPWRRARLVHGFEEKVFEALEKEKLLQAARDDASKVEPPLEGIVAPIAEELEAGREDNGHFADQVVEMVAATIVESAIPTEASVNEVQAHLPAPALQIRRPETWKPALQDLFSQRVISLRKQDVTLIALEGAAAGAAIVTCTTALILRLSR